MYTVEDLLRDIEADIEKAEKERLEAIEDGNDHRYQLIKNHIARLRSAIAVSLTYQEQHVTKHVS